METHRERLSTSLYASKKHQLCEETGDANAYQEMIAKFREKNGLEIENGGEHESI